MRNLLIRGACGLALLATPAIAQTTQPDAHMHKEGPPSSKLVRQIDRFDHSSFYLTNNRQTEVVDYSRNRDLALCVGRSNAAQARANAMPGPSGPVPLELNWRRQNSSQMYQAVVYPGNCLSFDAAHVTIEPKGDLPSGAVIRGTVRTAENYQSNHAEY